MVLGDKEGWGVRREMDWRLRRSCLGISKSLGWLRCQQDMVLGYQESLVSGGHQSGWVSEGHGVGSLKGP